MEKVALLYYHAVSGNLKMAVLKTEIPIHPLVGQIVPTFERLCHCFRGLAVDCRTFIFGSDAPEIAPCCRRFR